MLAVEDYIEALDTCINRLSEGETVDIIVRDYPELAAELRPMLEAGLLAPRARYPVVEVTQAQAQVQARVQAELQSGIHFFGWMIIATLILIVIIILTLLAFTPKQAESPSIQPTVNDTLAPHMQIEGELLYDENGASINGILIDDTEIDLPDSGIVRLTGELIDGQMIPESIEILTPNTTSMPTYVIEGTVEAITANTMRIFGIDIAVEADNPLLNVIQIGDVLRIEGEQHSDGIIAINIIFINVEVYVNEGEVWRDSGTCINAPPPWASATAWHLRCTNSNTGGGSGRSGRGRSQGSGRS